MFCYYYYKKACYRCCGPGQLSHWVDRYPYSAPKWLRTPGALYYTHFQIPTRTGMSGTLIPMLAYGFPFTEYWKIRDQWQKHERLRAKSYGWRWENPFCSHCIFTSIFRNLHAHRKATPSLLAKNPNCTMIHWTEMKDRTWSWYIRRHEYNKHFKIISGKPLVHL